MKITRRGKIARLPKNIREQLNERLENGKEANGLVEWLNGLSEVKAVLAANFGGQPINDQNLTNWRQGGYLDWQRHQETLEVLELINDPKFNAKALQRRKCKQHFYPRRRRTKP